MKMLRRTAAVTMTLALLLSAMPARAQVLELLPADAMAVVKIKSLQDVNQKIAALAQQWGLANIRPELADPLGTVLQMANLGPGLDKAGEAAIAIMKPVQGQEPDVLVLAPVSDFKAFVAALPNSKTEGEVITFQPEAKTVYVKNWGKFAAMSAKQEMIAKKPAGLGATGAAAKELAGKDVVAYFNIKSVRADVLPMIQQNKEKILAQTEKGLQQAQGMNPKMMPVFKAYFSQILNLAEGFIRDADSATFGINLSKEGVATTLLAEFQPSSYMGKSLKSMKNSDASFTAGLPEGKYFVYGGTTVDPVLVQMLNDFVAPIEKEIQGIGDEGKALQVNIDAMRSMLAAARQFNFGIVAPGANALAQQQGLIQAVNVISGDTAKLNEAQQKMLANMQEAIKTAPASLGMKVTSTPNAKTVAGVQLNQITASFNMQPQTPEEQQVAFVMQLLAGPNGFVSYSGVVNNQKMISVTGSDALVEAAVTAVKNNTDALAKTATAQVTAALPANRLAAWYLPLDQIASTVLDFMAAKGVPGGVQIPPNLPPLGGALSADGSAMRVDGFVPSQTVERLIAVGLQLYLQNMQGQQAPGAPKGL